ncbi:alpha/beta hydrolase [Thalassotalea psychrophila]|uniref:Alpha/beta hydrolase n=1 Tax=Thalassotalea psychrophila TaxID=3065647 RepID=A0ABY9TZF6_9GAMM|nr:alpha/beta hydrolase [Colwelliaceae bacterium SQ149]
MSVQNYLLKKFLRHCYKPKFTPELTLAAARQELDTVINNYMPTPCNSLQVETQVVSGVNCERIKHNTKRLNGTFLYVHGGCFAMGSALSHRGVTCEIAKEQLFDMVVPNYRLAPEHSNSAAVEDLLNVWIELINNPNTIKPIVLGGDQAGAYLALQLMLQLKQLSTPLPDAFIGISGLYDLSLTSASLLSNQELDCVNQLNVFERGINLFLATDADQEALIDPLNTSLEHLPPVLLQVANDEMLADDSRRLAETLVKHNVEVILEVWSDVPSCWHIAAVGLPEGRVAIKKIGKFIKKHCHR